MKTLLLYLCLTLSGQSLTTPTNDGGVWRVNVPVRSHEIEITSAEFDNASWEILVGKVRHDEVITVKGKKLLLGQEFEHKVSQRCSVVFAYKFDPLGNYLEIDHRHDIYSEDALVGEVNLKVAGKNLKVPLKSPQRKVFNLESNWRKLLPPGTDAKRFDFLAGRFGSSKDAFVVGYHIDDDTLASIALRLKYQKVGKNVHLKTSFDYLIGYDSVNPVEFTISVTERKEKSDFLTFKDLLCESLPLVRDRNWHHFEKTVNTTDFTDEISFMFRIKPIKDDGLVYGVAMIDNLKFDVLNQKNTP